MKTLSPSTGPVEPLSVAARLVAIITLFSRAQPLWRKTSARRF